MHRIPGLCMRTKAAAAEDEERSAELQDMNCLASTPLKTQEMSEPSPLDKLSFHLHKNANTKKLPRYIILHNSRFKALWDWFILALVIYTAIEIPYSAAFGFSNSGAKSPIHQLLAGKALAIVNLVVDLMFVVDIFINFRSTYTRQGTDEVVVVPRKIACNYLKTWFVVDFLAVIPFEFFYEAGSKGAISLAGLLKTARLLRLVRVSRKLDRYSEYGLAVVVLLTALFSLVAHWLACMWHAIGWNDRSNKHGWIWLLSKQIGKPINQSVPDSGPSRTARYVTSLYFTMTSLTSIGFGNVAPNTVVEKVFVIVMMLSGALMYAAIFGNMTAIIQRLYSRTARYHKDRKVIKEFIRFHKIPDILRDTLTEYFTHEWSSEQDQQLDTVLQRFPVSLQKDVCVHIHRKVLRSHSVFQRAGQGCLRALAVKFKIKNFLPGHYIIREEDEVTCFYFFVMGTVDVVKEGRSLSILGPGDSAGGDYEDMRTPHSLKANVSLLVRNYSEVHYIMWSDLCDVIESYPELEGELKRRLNFTHNFGRFISVEAGIVGNVPWSALVLSAPLGLSTINVPNTPEQTSRIVKKNSESKEKTQSNSIHSNAAPSKINGTASRTKQISEPLAGKTDPLGRVLSRMDSLDQRLLRVEDTLMEIVHILKEKNKSSSAQKEDTMFTQTSYL